MRSKRLAGMSALRIAAYASYVVVGAHLPYRPRPLRKLRTLMVHGYAPRVDPSAVVNKRAKISPGATIMAHAGVGARCAIPSGVTLEQHVMMGPDCLFLTGDHPVPEDGRFFGEYQPIHRAIVVEEDVFIGARVIVLPGVRIGRGAAIGAGAVVARDIPAGAVAVGNPARVVRQRTPPPPISEVGYRRVASVD